MDDGTFVPARDFDIEFSWNEDSDIWFANVSLQDVDSETHIAVAVPVDKVVTNGSSTNSSFAYVSGSGNVCLFSSSTAMTDITTNLTVLTGTEGVAYEVEVHFA